MTRVPLFREALPKKIIASRFVEIKLLRLSRVSILSLVLFALSLGFIAISLFINDSVKRDAAITAEFIQALGATEANSHELPDHQINELLDPRQDSRFDQREQIHRQKTRKTFFDNLKNLSTHPDCLLIHVYAPDSVVIWSSNPTLIGKYFGENKELEVAASTKSEIVFSYREMQGRRREQQFSHQPKYIFIENYIPLVNSAGEVVAVVEFYKEPLGLIARTQQSYLALWLTISLAGILIFQGLYLFAHQTTEILKSRRMQITENETSSVLGEMATVVAHSLNNPLAVVRSSAELALKTVTPPASRNITDIIDQVDRMSKWISNFHVASNPPMGKLEKINPKEIILEILRAFDLQLHNSNVQVKFSTHTTLPIISQTVLLYKILESLLANAIEAMPNGGLLHIEITPAMATGQVHITFHDSGKGMTKIQQQKLFHPYCTTKQQGLGIGLMMVKLIMESFGGQVRVTTSENEGTSVNLSFRIARSGRS